MKQGIFWSVIMCMALWLCPASFSLAQEAENADSKTGAIHNQEENNPPTEKSTPSEIKNVRLMPEKKAPKKIDIKPETEKGNSASSSREMVSELGNHWSYQYKDDLEGLLKRRYIRVLTTFNRTNFFLSDGEFYGFEYEILRDYEEYLNKQVKRKELRIALEFIPCERDELVPKLLNGYGDIAAAGLTVTDERRKKAAFTTPYLKGVDELVVTRKDGPKIETLEDLSERKVHVRKSSSYYESLTAFNKKLNDTGLPPVQLVPVDESLETEDILELVNIGVFDITVCDSSIAETWSGILKNIQLNRDLRLRENGRIAWMIRKNAPELKASLNRFLKTRKQGTLLGNIYFKRYYEKNKWIADLLCMVEEKKIKKIRTLIKKYAGQYGVDWQLIMAMAFQESRFDQSKRSRQGAVGVMQVRPATGLDKNIAIKNVHKLENNIHAGIKYLVFLKNHYFNVPEINKRDKMRFSLAAYNLGPAKLKKAREKAEKIGLDPNRWFRNVEKSTLRLYGQETVRFVSNINRYYLKYQLALENREARKSAKDKVLREVARGSR